MQEYENIGVSSLGVNKAKVHTDDKEKANTLSVQTLSALIDEIFR